MGSLFRIKGARQLFAARIASRSGSFVRGYACYTSGVDCLGLFQSEARRRATFRKERDSSNS